MDRSTLFDMYPSVECSHAWIRERGSDRWHCLHCRKPGKPPHTAITPQPQPRAQEQAALVLGDGWIEWKGGECPVPAKTRVDLKFRDGIVIQETVAGDYWHWRYDRPKRNQHCDIVAYKVLP